MLLKIHTRRVSKLDFGLGANKKDKKGKKAKAEAAKDADEDIPIAETSKGKKGKKEKAAKEADEDIPIAPVAGKRKRLHEKTPAAIATPAIIKRPAAIKKPAAAAPSDKIPMCPPTGHRDPVYWMASTVYMSPNAFRVKDCPGSRATKMFPYGKTYTRLEAWGAAVKFIKSVN